MKEIKVKSDNTLKGIHNVTFTGNVHLLRFHWESFKLNYIFCNIIPVMKHGVTEFFISIFILVSSLLLSVEEFGLFQRIV